MKKNIWEKLYGLVARRDLSASSSKSHLVQIAPDPYDLHNCI